MSFVPKNHPQQTNKHGVDDKTDDRRTPPDLLEECRVLAGVDVFTLDVAASHENAVTSEYHTLEDDGLGQPWSGHVWCNPPYSDLKSWVPKACQEAQHCESITMLLPANRTEQGFWQDWIEPLRRDGLIDVYFLRGRRRFDRPGWTKPKKGDRPPFGLCVVVWS